jgi:hypothetical protein
VHVAALFLDLLRAAELEQSFAASGFGRHAGGYFSLNRRFQVEANFRIQLLFDF